jgi:hypothetical protein
MTSRTLTILERIGDRVAQQGPAVDHVFAEGRLLKKFSTRLSVVWQI